ncbi:hypothetical protein D3C78_1331280 [compost metagenome]
MQEFGFHTQLAGSNLQKVACQAGNIFTALAQRRQMDADHVQAVEQILTEFAFLHTLLQILVCRGDNAHVHFHRRVSTDAIELTIR